MYYQKALFVTLLTTPSPSRKITKKKNNKKNNHLFSLCNWEPVRFAADFLWNLDMQETC